MAHQLEISQTKLSNVENGTTKKVDVKMLNKICDFFGVGFDYFLNEKVSTESNKNNRDVCVCVCVDKHIHPSDNFPNNILSQIKLLIQENQDKTQRILDLENKLKQFKNN